MLPALSTITISLPDELVSRLRATASRKKVTPDVIVGEALATQLEAGRLAPSASSVAAIIGQDFGKYEGVSDLSTNPRYLNDLGQ